MPVLFSKSLQTQSLNLNMLTNINITIHILLSQFSFHYYISNIPLCYYFIYQSTVLYIYFFILFQNSNFTTFILQQFASMDDQSFDQIHLIKLKLISKTSVPLKISCPYHSKFIPIVQLKNKSCIYVPLINSLIISKSISSNVNAFQIPIDIQPLLQHPFDKHNLKMQTYQDKNHTKKGQIVNLHLQFSLFLTTKGQTNYVELFFKHANLKKDLQVFGKMSPYFVIWNDQWRYKSREIKNGHLNPKFDEEVAVPFNSVFDKIIIELRHGQQKIGYEALYVFELFGKDEQREIQLKKEHKMVGSLNFVVSEFDPEDF